MAEAGNTGKVLPTPTPTPTTASAPSCPQTPRHARHPRIRPTARGSRGKGLGGHRGARLSQTVPGGTVTTHADVQPSTLPTPRGGGGGWASLQGAKRRAGQRSAQAPAPGRGVRERGHRSSHASAGEGPGAQEGELRARNPGEARGGGGVGTPWTPAARGLQVPACTAARAGCCKAGEARCMLGLVVPRPRGLCRGPPLERAPRRETPAAYITSMTPQTSRGTAIQAAAQPHGAGPAGTHRRPQPLATSCRRFRVRLPPRPRPLPLIGGPVRPQPMGGERRPAPSTCGCVMTARRGGAQGRRPLIGCMEGRGGAEVAAEDPEFQRDPSPLTPPPMHLSVSLHGGTHGDIEIQINYIE